MTVTVLVHGRRLAVALLIAVLADCVCSCGRADVHRYRRGELGPAQAADEDPLSGMVTHMSVLMLLVVVARSRVCPFLSNRLWTLPSVSKAVICATLLLPNAIFVVPFSLVVALYTFAGLPTNLVPWCTAGYKRNRSVASKNVTFYTYIGNDCLRMYRVCRCASIHDAVVASYRHSVRVCMVENKCDGADLVTSVLSLVGGMSILIHTCVVAAVAVYVYSVHLKLVATALAFPVCVAGLVIMSVVIYKKISKCGLLVFQSTWNAVQAAMSNPVSVPGTHTNHSAQEQAVARENQGGTLPCEMQTRKRARKDDIGGNDDPVPPKRGQGRPIKHGNLGECGPCVLWLYTDPDPNIEQYHRSNTMRHPTSLEQAAKLSLYGSTDTLSVRVNEDSCICNGCYMDFVKAPDTSVKPRWLKKKEEHYASPHCIACCERYQTPMAADCSCRDKPRNSWGPSNWLGAEDWSSLKTYLVNTGFAPRGTPNYQCDICSAHYHQVYNLLRDRTCSVCTLKTSSRLHLASSLTNVPLQFFSLDTELGDTDWVCEQCILCASDVERFQVLLQTQSQSCVPNLAVRAELIGRALSVIDKEGIVYTLPYIQEYKAFVEDKLPEQLLSRSVLAFSKYLERAADAHGCRSFCKAKKLGRVLYNPDRFNPDSIPYVCDMLVQNYQLSEDKKKLEASAQTVESIRSSIQNQVKKFPPTGTFDFRTLVNEKDGSIDESALYQYVDKDLVKLIDELTQSEHSRVHPGETPSELYRDTRMHKILMVIAVLCNTMNPNSSFLQTLVGLSCFSSGLRDVGFEQLNALGVCCSIDQLRRVSRFWAENRDCKEEIPKDTLWRVSIDNLEFKFRFAKSLGAGEGGLNRMLHLMTAQVVTGSDSSVDPPTSSTVPSLQSLAKNVVKNIQAYSGPVERTALTEDHFKPQKSDWHLGLWDKIAYYCTHIRAVSSNKKPTQWEDTLISQFQSLLPAWTPPTRDNVVLATVAESYSAEIGDVEEYLRQLKSDLGIGQEGFPADCLLVADQQVHAIVKKLKKHGSEYDWIHPYPGEWHELKLASEVLRDLLWDGGLQQLASACGHKGELKQWQDIHYLLLALYEALLREGVTEFGRHRSGKDQECTPFHGKEFWQWITSLREPDNKDEVSRFWATALIHLHAYVGFYLAIRSGNWHLRNSTVKCLVPLFFAYGHDKYQQLSMESFADFLTFPAHVAKPLVNAGEWTASLTGRPHHNVALDEAHEMVINRRLKQITSRASHFRTVELADFMAYLEKVQGAWDRFLSRSKKDSEASTLKRYACQRVECIQTILEGLTVPLFKHSSDPNPLRNVFVASAAKLPTSTIEALLEYCQTGLNWMMDYVKQYVLDPPTEKPQGKKRRKLPTFTHKQPTARKQKTIQKNAARMVRNMSRYVQARLSDPTPQVHPFPLAIADMDGSMRPSSKSDILQVIQSRFGGMFSDQCVFPDPANVGVIVDFLYFLHKPPPTHVRTFDHYCTYLWNRAVASHSTNLVYVVIDKPPFLPPPRELVHKARASKHSAKKVVPPSISDSCRMPSANEFAALMSSDTFKAKLVDYVSHKFVQKAKSSLHLTLVMDSPAFDTPIRVQHDQVCPLPPNEHGEADYAIWHHAIHCPASNILIVASDSDTWVYGLGLSEVGLLAEKTVFVQRGTYPSENQYVHINLGVRLIMEHPKLSQLRYPVSSLVALYVLTGSDYVSRFNYVTKERFFKCFLENLSHICSNGEELVLFCQPGTYPEFDSVHMDTWLKLVCAAYLSMSKDNMAYLGGESIGSTYDLLCSDVPVEMYPPALQVVVAHTLPPSTSLQSTRDWYSFVRFVVTMRTLGSDEVHPPSVEAIVLHAKRAEYVLKLVFSAPNSRCNDLMKYDMYGWTGASGSIEIQWDSQENLKRLTGSTGGCSCKTGCNSRRCGCVSRHDRCSPLCKCINCSNSQAIQTGQESESDSSSESEEETDERIEVDIVTDAVDEFTII